jgi:glucose-6-phosphate isomerase
MSLTDSSAWQKLAHYRDAFKGADYHDAARLDRFEVACGGLKLNYAFQNIDAQGISLLLDLARQQKIEQWRARMFAGDKINTTEDRAVLHTALRRDDDRPVLLDGVDMLPEIRTTQNRIAAFVEAVRSGTWQGATGKVFKHIVNIGIGGSDLGPRLAVQALRPFVSGLDVHFVANADAFDIAHTLEKLDPAQTLFVIVSKTFTTQETLLNAQTARGWLVERLGEAAVAQHFVAVSVNRAEVEKFGIHKDNLFPMWDWVGGRFSLWSAVGLSVALAIGMNNFRRLLAGAAAMDTHFQSAPLERNMPVLLAMLGIWNRNFMGAGALAILPYAERLRDLPRYLQQLEMESNGKSVTRDGAKASYGTAPVLFGECGTVGQHSFHQWLHQGSDPIPADFIGVAEDDLNRPEHHAILTSHLVAQIGALAFGQPQAATPQDIYPGHRSSNLLWLAKLDPYHLGMLLALYEHKVFVQGVIWNINSFDQPGVELGKRIAKDLQKPAGGGEKASVMAEFMRKLSS